MFKNKVLFKRSVILFYIWYVYYVVSQTIIRCQGRTIIINVYSAATPDSHLTSITTRDIQPMYCWYNVGPAGRRCANTVPTLG